MYGLSITRLDVKECAYLGIFNARTDGPGGTCLYVLVLILKQ